MQLVSVFLFVFAVALPLVFAGAILRYIDRAARLKNRPVKVHTVDFFSLIFLVQIPMAIAIQVENRGDQAGPILASIGFGAMMALIWWTTIKAVSRAGIDKFAYRFWISLLVIPMTYVGSFAIIAIGVTMNTSRYPFGALIAIELVLIALLVVSLLVTLRAVKHGELGPEVQVDSPYD